MATTDKKDIWVYADWLGMAKPKCIGVLSAHQTKGRSAFSFTYNQEWIDTEAQLLLDPDIGWYTGPQFSSKEGNFGAFLDSMPDTWGRTLLKRREYILAKTEERKVRHLFDIDFLLGVYDETRMGALRFKLEKEGPFLDHDAKYSTPPWSSIRELQHSAKMLESDQGSEDIQEWLAILLAPGSSLGGARPKANILDDEGHPWIAKFPSRNDTIDKAAWEYLAYRLAQSAGLIMAESKIQKVAGRFHTFFTKRFDRYRGERIHFASAMTMTGNNEKTIRDQPASYLDLAEFIQYNGQTIATDLEQLWRRIIFNIAISNTDDHLRNHGFIIQDGGWRLSPAYDLNPSVDKKGLSLNIDMDNNALDFELAKSVGVFFQLDNKKMDAIVKDVTKVVSGWETLAKELGISRRERELMTGAFYTSG